MTALCASCGIAEVDEIKLKECDDCDLVRYCSDECQTEHKTEHTEACKKRAAELRDELLFKQPESSHFGDCPICCIPLSLDIRKSPINECCSKVICNGCSHAHRRRAWEKRLEQSCPFCREPVPNTEKESAKLRMKRVKANDPVAIRQEGVMRYNKGEYIKAYYTKAAELGDAEAHYQLSILYQSGKGVEKDEGKKIYHLEEAAIAGHPFARYVLGVCEWRRFRVENNRNDERAVKHWIIAARQGDGNSIKELMKIFKHGQKYDFEYISKEDLAAALRAHKTVVDATKSPQRDTAEEFYNSDYFKSFIKNKNKEG